MKLQIGSATVKGRYKSKEWVNLDLDLSHRSIDVCGDMTILPFKDGSFDEIHCIHVLEHVTRDKQIPALEEMHRVLHSGGFVLIEVPDIRGLVQQLNHYYNIFADSERIRIKKVAIFGKSERPGMAHFWGFDYSELKNKCLEAGFRTCFRIEDREQYISTHFKHDPIILLRANK